MMFHVILWLGESTFIKDPWYCTTGGAGPEAGGMLVPKEGGTPAMTKLGKLEVGESG